MVQYVFGWEATVLAPFELTVHQDPSPFCQAALHPVSAQPALLYDSMSGAGLHIWLLWFVEIPLSLFLQIFEVRLFFIWCVWARWPKFTSNGLASQFWESPMCSCGRKSKIVHCWFPLCRDTLLSSAAGSNAFRFAFFSVFWASFLLSVICMKWPILVLWEKILDDSKGGVSSRVWNHEGCGQGKRRVSRFTHFQYGKWGTSDETCRCHKRNEMALHTMHRVELLASDFNVLCGFKKGPDKLMEERLIVDCCMKRYLSQRAKVRHCRKPRQYFERGKKKERKKGGNMFEHLLQKP